jgi:hypothetical protein
MIEQISRNYVLGVPVKDVYELQELAKNHKSVYSKHWKIKPASVIMSMQCRMVLNIIEQGTIYTIVNLKDVK